MVISVATSDSDLRRHTDGRVDSGGATVALNSLSVLPGRRCDQRQPSVVGHRALGASIALTTFGTDLANHPQFQPPSHELWRRKSTTSGHFDTANTRWARYRGRSVGCRQTITCAAIVPHWVLRTDHPFPPWPGDPVRQDCRRWRARPRAAAYRKLLIESEATYHLRRIEERQGIHLAASRCVRKTDTAVALASVDRVKVNHALPPQVTPRSRSS